MPLAVFAANNVSPVRTTFAGGSSDVVEAVYNGSIDAGAIYYAEREPDGRIHDARLNLVSKHKDMLDKVEIIYISDPIPTTPIVFRAGLNPTIKDKIANAFSKFNADLVVIGALNKLYGATGVLPADDKRYDAIRDMLKKLGKDVTEVVPGAVNFYKTHLWDVVPTY
jgi:phosphonate transport system substrate-binding protein